MMKQLLATGPASGLAPGRARRLRPLLTAALGLLTLGTAWAQRLAPAVSVATYQGVAASLLPGSGTAPAAQLFTASPGASQLSIQAAISSTATGGNWSAPATWVGGVVPTAADNVTIVGGATVTLDVAAVAGALTVASGGTLVTSATAAYSLQVGGSVTNNGTLTMSASATLGSDLRFVGAGSVTFGGTGTTDLYTLSLAKSVLADVVEMNLPTLSVKGTANATTGFLFTRTTGTTPADDMVGTLKISGTATLTNRVFGNTAAYIIPATGAFWLNNPNFTVSAQTGSPTVNGQLRLSAGTFNVGVTSGNSISFGSAAVLTVDGGTLSAAGRVGNFTAAASVTGSMTFTLSGGAINVATVGNASGTPSFGVNGTTTISGGAINLVQRSTATTPLDYYVAGTYNFTGGTLNVGSAATATNFDFRIRGNVPNLNIDNTTNAKTALLAGQTNPFGTVTIPPTATLNLNGSILVQLGPTITNNGTLTGTATGSRLYFQGSVAQSIGGTGTVTSPLLQITFQNSSTGVTVGMPIATRNVAMLRGNVSGANNLTVQSTTTALAVISFGTTSPTSSAGTFDVAPTFDLSSSGLYLIYNPELAPRTTGVEVPSSRTLYYADFNNPQGITVAGGDLTVVGPSSSSSSLSLLAGIVTTSAGNRLISGSATTVMPSGSATAYINGPFGITVNSAAAVSRLFAVGDAAAFRPVVVSGITTSTDQTFTATVVSGATGGRGIAPISGLNPTRYVRLQNSASLPATATVQLSYGADDVIGAPATAVVAQAATAAGAYASVGGAAAAAPTTGIVSTQNITPGQDYFVLANTEGGTLATSVATGCAGSTSGTLTLSGTAAGSSVVKYQADSGSGFADLPGTNTGSTYTFTNLTATTTFRAVLLTSDGRTVFSAPVTVNVTPLATASFSYPAGPYCVSGTTNPVPTVTGATGGSFNSTAGLVINATTGVITLASSTPGTYVVTYTLPTTCSTSVTQSITINAAPTAGFSYPAGPYCTSGATNPAATLASGATAGTFTSTAGLTLNAATGAITLASSAPGTYTVTNTVAASGGCAAVASTATLTIAAPATAGFSYPAAAVCAGSAGTVAPTLASGATAGTFTSTTGLSLNATTGVVSVASSAAGTYTVTNTVAAVGGCAAVVSTASITITAPTTATFSYAGSPFCQSGTNPAPTITGTAGGTFSAPAGLLLNASTGVIALAGSTPGTYVVTYTVAGSCGSSSTQTVVITAPATAGFSYAGSPFCRSATTNPVVTLASGATAGTFTSTTGLALNAATGAITLASSTPGTYTVTNTVAASGGCAAVTSTATVTITAAPLANIGYGAASYCTSTPGTVALGIGTGSTRGTITVSPATGLTIAADGTITPATSTPGTYFITNTVAASGGCAAVTGGTTVTITAAPTAGFGYVLLGNGTVCAGGAGTFAPTLAGGATAGTFTATTGLALNPTTGVISLAGSTAGTYTITNTVAASGGCGAVSSTATFTINATPATPVLTSSGTAAGGITLTSSSATGNQFYLNGSPIAGATGQTYLINSGTRNGSYTVVVTGAGGCTSAASAAVTVTVTASAPAAATTALKLYPNPTPSGLLTLELSGYREAVQLTISNALGQRVYEGVVLPAALAQPKALDLSALPAGLYVLQARTASGGVEVRRIVRQ